MKPGKRPEEAKPSQFTESVAMILEQFQKPQKRSLLSISRTIITKLIRLLIYFWLFMSILFLASLTLGLTELQLDIKNNAIHIIYFAG